MLDFNVKDLSNGELIKLRMDVDRILDTRSCDALHNLKIGSLITYKQLDGSSHNYLVVDYQEDYSYFFKVLHYYISPDGKIKMISVDAIDVDQAPTLLMLLDSKTTVTQTGLTEDEYDKRRTAFYMELIEEFTMDEGKKDEW